MAWRYLKENNFQFDFAWTEITTGQNESVTKKFLIIVVMVLSWLN